MEVYTTSISEALASKGHDTPSPKYRDIIILLIWQYIISGCGYIQPLWMVSLAVHLPGVYERVRTVCTNRQQSAKSVLELVVSGLYMA